MGTGRPIDPPRASELCWRSSGDEWSDVDRWMASERFVINTLPRFFREFRGSSTLIYVSTGQSRYETLREKINRLFLSSLLERYPSADNKHRRSIFVVISSLDVVASCEKAG